MAEIAEQADRMARRIVLLTWALFFLTAGLLFYTVMLYKAETQHQQGERIQPDHYEKQRTIKPDNRSNQTNGIAPKQPAP